MRRDEEFAHSARPRPTTDFCGDFGVDLRLTSSLSENKWKVKSQVCLQALMRQLLVTGNTVSASLVVLFVDGHLPQSRATTEKVRAATMFSLLKNFFYTQCDNCYEILSLYS